MDLDVPVHRLLTAAFRLQTEHGESFGELVDLLPKAVADGGEVPSIAGDECGVGFRRESVGKVERVGHEGQTGSDVERMPRQASAARHDSPSQRGSCGKPPAPTYS